MCCHILFLLRVCRDSIATRDVTLEVIFKRPVKLCFLASCVASFALAVLVSCVQLTRFQFRYQDTRLLRRMCKPFFAAATVVRLRARALDRCLACLRGAHTDRDRLDRISPSSIPSSSDSVECEGLIV
jgi:hypothetical protein